MCAAYYSPVFAFICGKVRDSDIGRDLTQEFFMRLLSRRGIDTVKRERGRFRSFLLGAVKHFLADYHEHSRRLKRGGGRVMEPIEVQTDTSPGLEIADEKTASAEREFDRRWGLTLLDRALTTLAAEHTVAGTSNLFEALKPWLTGDTEDLSQAETAGKLGMNEGAVKVAIHRLRRRFRDLIKTEIAQTLNDEAQVEDEMHCLLEALV
ncbi:MAG TPA: sigma factor-like helix-turn-helix DNA-binding protein [Verrucomicrobiae bacterium]|nr:sigma factor-like helix-turn-helix DNA-binding protein [Verrucomicrobiae bacterium]